MANESSAMSIAAVPLDALMFALMLIVLAVVVWYFFKNLLVNTVFGVIALLLINLLADAAAYPAIKINITIVTVIISALLGLAGVGLLILLKLLGVVIQ